MSRLEERRAFWDDKILRWERARYSALAWLNPFAWTVRERLRVATELVTTELRECRAALDLGCGSGQLARAFVASPQRSYLGVDLSPRAVEAARRAYAGVAPRIGFECGDALACLDKPCDLAVFLGLTDWLDDSELDRLFAGLRRQGRRLLFSFTERASAAARPYGGYRRWADGPFRARSLVEADVLRRLERTGFRPKAVVRSAAMGPGRLVLADAL